MLQKRRSVKKSEGKDRNLCLLLYFVAKVQILHLETRMSITVALSAPFLPCHGEPSLTFTVCLKMIET